MTEEQIKEAEAKEENLDEYYESIQQKKPEPDALKVETKKELKSKRLWVEDLKDEHNGKVELNNEIIPSEAMFYFHDIKFLLRGGQTSETRIFSSYANKDNYTVNRSINGILRPTVNISGSGKRLTSNSILEIDKLFFMLAIRDLTFYQIPNPLINNCKCPKCSEPCKIEIFSNNTTFLKLDPKLQDYYRADKKNYTFNFDGEEPLEVKPPTIMVTEIISNYIETKNELGIKVDKPMLENIKYLDLEWETITVDAIDKVLMRSFNWSLAKYSMLLKFVEDFKKQIVTETFGTCDSCSAEVTVPFRFQGGLLSCFLIQDPYGHAG